MLWLCGKARPRASCIVLTPVTTGKAYTPEQMRQGIERLKRKLLRERLRRNNGLVSTKPFFKVGEKILQQKSTKMLDGLTTG
jgi:hypothetical protein